MSLRRTSFIDAVEAGVLSAKMREERQPDYNRTFTGLLFSLFIVALLIAIVVGVHVYSALSADRTATDDERLAMSLLVNDVRANDAVGSIAMGQGPEGHSLVLLERLPVGTYETRIYQYKNHIVQEYAMAGAAYTPESATQIVESRRFDFSYAKGLLTLTTDQGITSVALRSVIEGG